MPWFRQMALALLLEVVHTADVDSVLTGQKAPVLAGPFSGTWWSVGTMGKATAVRTGAFHLGRYGDATALLNRPGSTRNGAYGLRMDLTRDEEPSNWTGYGCNVQFAVNQAGKSVKLWYVELLKDTASAYHTLDGQWQILGSTSTSAFANGTLFELEIYNDVGGFNATLTAIIGAKSQVVFSTGTVAHDGHASDHGNITVSCADQTAAFISQVFVTRPLVPPLPRPSAVDPTSTKAAGGEHMEAWTAADGRVFLRSTGGKQFAGVLTLSAEEADINSKKASTATTALISMSSVNATQFTQHYIVGNSKNGAHAVLDWSLSTGHAGCKSAADCSILQDLKVTLSMVTAVAQSRNRTFRLTMRLEPTDAGFDPQALLSFRQRFDSVRGTLPQRSEFGLRPVDTVVFGTERMSLLESELGATTSIDPSTGIAVRGSVLKHAYLPIISVFGPALNSSKGSGSSSGGYAVLADPRSSWVLRYGVGGILASRLFFLGARQGSVDRGYFNGDVETQYTLRFALPVGVDGGSEDNWARLFDMYRRLNPWMMHGPQLPPGLFVDGLPTKKTLPRFQELHATVLGLMNLFYPENQTNQTCNGCHAGDTPAAQVARDAGIGLHVWTNIRMASNTSNVVAEDPLMDYRLFPDSLQRDAAGNLLPCWDGFSMNPDTRVGSFGKFQLQRIKNWVTKFNLDGVFLDFYGDTTDVDVSRRYGQFPFYPMQVAEIQWAKSIATWAHSAGKYIIVNCPEASMAVQHLVDLVTCDSNGVLDHWSMGDRLVSQAFGKRHLLLPNLGPPATTEIWLQHANRALFYGEIPCPWQPTKGLQEQTVMDRMAASVYPLAMMIADSTPLGGDFNTMWYRSSSNGSAFIALNNDHPNGVLETRVSLAPLYHLPSEGDFEAVLWDGLAVFATVATGSATELSSQVFSFLLEANSTRVLAFVPPGALQS